MKNFIYHKKQKSVNNIIGSSKVLALDNYTHEPEKEAPLILNVPFPWMCWKQINIKVNSYWELL